MNTSNPLTAVDEDSVLLHSSLSVVDTDHGVGMAITEDYEVLKQIVATEKFVDSLPTADIPFFAIKGYGGKAQLTKNKHGHAFIDLLLSVAPNVMDLYPLHQYSPRFMLFVNIVKKYGLESLSQGDLSPPPSDLQQQCNALNACVGEMCRLAKSSRFVHSLRQHTKASLKNYRGALRYVDYLFTQHKRLLVIRLDLGYQQRYRWTDSGETAVSLNECFEHRAEFIRQLPSLIPTNKFVRYIWKTEFKLSKSLHHHLIVFLDGSESCQDVTIARILGEHWEKDITQSRGIYWNVNAKIDKNDPRYGVGMVHVSDAKRMENLKEYVVGYLCKPDYHIRWAVPAKHRTFGKSEERMPVG